jgi:urease accessory protein
MSIYRRAVDDTGRPAAMRRREARQASARSEKTLTSAALLQLMRLASPSLPVGGFSYSEGLEAAVESGHVANEAQALSWLLDQLHLGLARSDLAIVAKAAVAWQRGDGERIATLNAWVSATRETSEWRQQSEQMGRSLCLWMRNRGKADDRVALLEALMPAPTWPVAFALAGVASGAPVRDVLLAFAAGWAENMAQAAMKAVPLGQGAGQRILAGLTEAIPDAADAALALPLVEMRAFTPMLAILSSQHEEQYSRLFRS